MGFFWVLGSVYEIFVGSQALPLYTFYVLRGALRFFLYIQHYLSENKCTKFFHKVANSNRRKNSIDSLLIGGTILPTAWRTTNTLSNFTKICILSSLVEDFYWTAFLLILLVRQRPISWRENSE
jgi:hypothetical protein